MLFVTICAAQINKLTFLLHLNGWPNSGSLCSSVREGQSAVADSRECTRPYSISAVVAMSTSNGVVGVKQDGTDAQMESKMHVEDMVDKVVKLTEKKAISNAGSNDAHKTSTNILNMDSEGSPVLPSMTEIETAIDELDQDIENAFGRAADSIWSIASSMGSAVRQTQPGLDLLRKNVTSHLAPIDSFGRDLSTQIGALAPKEDTLTSLTGSITGSITSVAESVQRKASAMEAAILATANSTGGNVEEVKTEAKEDNLRHDDSTANPDSVLPFVNDGVEGLAKVSETISNSLVGQTVGGIWDGLWGGEEEEDDEEWEDERPADDVPRTRFEERLFEIQANPDTYCKPASDLAAFEKWGENFDLDEVAEHCVGILHKHGAIADLYIKVVPSMVEENTFWMRYYFAKYVLEKEEERRRKLLKQAQSVVEGGDTEDDGWGDDDWGDGEDNAECKLKKSNTSKGAGPSTKEQSANQPKEAESAATTETKEETATAYPMNEVVQSIAPADASVKGSESNSETTLAKTPSKDVDEDWEDDWE